MRCAACSAEIDRPSAFCPGCGAALAGGAPGGAGDDATLAAPGDAAATLAAPPPGRAATAPRPAAGAPAASTPSPASAVSGARFPPGTVLAGRYRIISVLGRGGMGEVYRAEDLKLGQEVALKFLPASAERDTEWLDRFLGEVRLARRISNPNVCRVFDVGEVDGHHFLSMEYIDGEDLASLLRRIGRLPQDKAIQIARQICAGLAAAHAEGILHRDLKPANVMIDGRGNARLTDFGLAGFAAEIEGAEVRSGTPAYMAPEQLAGREVSVRSDLYALGLVLYELMTGRRAFTADSVAELTRQQRETTPASPSSHVEGIDPAVERVILRCLEPDPGERPGSALAVSAALPGGDPLAAALAAGETPSPELVAAAGEEGTLAPRHALALLAAFAALTVVFVAVAGRYQFTGVVPLERPRDVLIEDARTILAAGDSERPAAADRAWGFSGDFQVQLYLQSLSVGDRWAALARGRPASLRFWYRESPQPLAPRGLSDAPSWSDPPATVGGMAAVRLDTRGRLLELVRVPRQLDDEPAGEPAAGPDWPRLFAAAGLELERFTAAEPRWVPPVYADARLAWTGAPAEGGAGELRVEAAAWRGEPVYFRLVGPWSRPERDDVWLGTARSRVNQVLTILLLLAMLATSLFLAHRNLGLGRGDRRGALRLAVFNLAVVLAAWLLTAHHLLDADDEFTSLVKATGQALFGSLGIWAFYLALEPYVRRHNPERIVAWSRLLAGRWRDPLVGRDVLIGAVAGGAIAVLLVGSAWATRAAGVATSGPAAVFFDGLSGTRHAIGRFLISAQDSIFGAMFVLFLWFLLRRLLPWRWAAGVVLLGVLALNFSAYGAFSWFNLAIASLIAGLLLAMLLRFGLLSLIATLVFGIAISNQPIPTPPSAWYGQGSWVVLALLAALAVQAFRIATAGRRPLAEALPAE